MSDPEQSICSPWNSFSMLLKSSAKGAFICIGVILCALTGCDKYQPPEEPVAKSRPKIEMIEVNPDFRSQGADFDFNAGSDPQSDSAPDPSAVGDNSKPSSELPTVDEAIAGQGPRRIW